MVKGLASWRFSGGRPGVVIDAGGTWTGAHHERETLVNSTSSGVAKDRFSVWHSTIREEG
jgi:hypothetical protein